MPEPLRSSLFDPVSVLHGILRFVDVDQSRLVVATSDMKYVTLSYIWGVGLLHLLRGLSLDRFSSKEGFASVLQRLPRTIYQSIELVNRLGYRYIWVDYMCINQDSQEEKEVLIRMMDRIYGNSVFTICAAGGDGQLGIPGVLPKSRDLTQQVE